MYKKSVDETIKSLKTNISGLTKEESEKRLKENGKNELKETKKASTLKLFVNSFKEPLVIILLIASFTQVFLGEYVESSIIFLVLMLNSILGVFQTKKAESSLNSLKKLSIPEAKVIRENQKLTISSCDLVVGDIVIVEAGDYIPADGRVIESQSLKVIEGMLTGESNSILKHSNKIENDCSLGDMKNMVFSGSMVVYGRGTFVVTNTGMNTEIGKIANLLQNAENKQTPLQIKLEDFSKKLGVLIILLSLSIFGIQVLKGADISDSFMFSIAIAVAAIPEALSSIVTIVLAFGTNTMAKKQAIIRKLPAVETLGSTSVICTDKTGTLTQNKMTVVEVFTKSNNINSLVLSSILCNDSDITSENIEIGDPTEVSLVNYAIKNNINYKNLRNVNKRISEIPFDSDRKLMSTLNKVNSENIMFVKGAPDVVFSRCKYVLVNDKVVNINDEILDEFKQTNENFSNKALRVLAFATKKVDNDNINLDDENNLTLIGLMAMIDPPRKEVYDAIKCASESGIKTIMITGDHKTTAVAIAKEIKIFKDGDISLTGKELDEIDDDKLDEILEKVSVYARVSPENKIRIVKAWQRKGKICAMTGDGVNDAPSIKQADIGISMGSGTEVSKDASSMVLVDDNFATIVNAIEVGRTVYNNIKKSITYLFSGNLGGIIAILYAVFVGFKNPFTTIQLLFINLVTDSLPAIALGLEESEKNVMKNPPNDINEKIFEKETLKSILTRGTIIGIVTIISQYIGMKTSPDMGVAMAFSTLTLSRILQTFSLRSNSETIFKLGFTSNKYVLYSVVVCILIFSMTLLLPFRNLFDIPMEYSFDNFITCFSLAIASTVFMETTKLIKNNKKR